MSCFSRPPFFVKNLKPLRLKGRWLAVIIIAPSNSYTGITVDMNMAGVDASPASVQRDPSMQMPRITSFFRSSPESRESVPMQMFRSYSLLPSFSASQ